MTRRSLASTLWWVLGSLALGIACSDDDGGAGPTGPPGPAPAVEATRIFDDAPLEGELTFVSSGASDGTGTPWRFEVDLGADGTVDASGEALAGATVPYRFESPGVHPIRITLEQGGERVVRERPVVVNDPSRIEVLGTSRIFDDILEGVTLDRTGSLLFVTRFDGSIAVLDPITLSVLNEFGLSGRSGSVLSGTLEGLGAAPDEDLLYVATKSFQLGVAELAGTEVTDVLVHSVPTRYFVHPLPGRQAYVSGEGLNPGIVLIDAETGEFLAEETALLGNDSGHFALSRDGSRLAVIDLLPGPEDHAILLTDAALVEQARVEVPRERAPMAVAWSPSGDKLIARYFDSRDPSVSTDGACGILVVDPAVGAILDEIELGSICGSGNEIGVANPIASTPDGRLAVLPTRAGVFLLDLVVGLPVARVQAPGDLPDECCDVAGSPNEDVFYVATRSGHVVRLRIHR